MSKKKSIPTDKEMEAMDEARRFLKQECHRCGYTRESHHRFQPIDHCDVILICPTVTFE